MTQTRHPSQPTLPIHRIVQGKNPRDYFDPDEMAELEQGIRAVGVLEPLVVRPVLGTPDYAIIAGERRWRAARNVFGDDYAVPVVIKEVGDETAEAMALIENYHRAAMSPAEEAHAAQRQLLRQRGDKAETARLMGWSLAVLERRLGLLACSPAVLQALTSRRIQLGHAELLAGVLPDKQDGVLAGLLAQQVPVAVLKAQLGRYARRLADAVFDTTGCADCAHNSARQAGLFAESLGEGYCQHPRHYEELTQAAVHARAETLREEFPNVRIVEASEGFVPLPVAPDGALGVGAPQYTACQGCQSFGSAVSAMAGSVGEVTRSLCFDAACHSQKVAVWRKAQRRSASGDRAADTASAPTARSARAAGTRTVTNQTPPRVVAYRLAAWRQWVARALMAQPVRNQRVLIALACSGHAGDVRATEYGQALRKTAPDAGCSAGRELAAHLEEADRLDAAHLERLVQAVAASAAFGVSERDLLALLQYLEVDERRYFQWDDKFLALFTMSELESLAAEVGLRQAMGVRFKAARAGRKPAFIAALLGVGGFAYQGTVPAAMRYPRAGDAASEPREPDAAPSDAKDATDSAEPADAVPDTPRRGAVES
ncbi:PRTRC system ParB family protein [Pseudorhodoferax sp. Leaf267]|uniref:PRTRC system ParB family protein n=1 Tax=Pseudorhodoferax sp. Leaf267 TaxID=1736316 RepID=UPI0006FEFD96|nr:PRTRC system ParB family protein [Pseudorhodoferax sp. Leaf267]KQP15170.1 chromosome partitioning protein ParB [Pseudorhodoferax sp. Leaf267]